MALDLVTRQLDWPRPLGPRTRGMSLRLLAQCSDLRKRPSILRTAIDMLQESGDRYQLAVTLAYLAECHQELGELGRARMTTRRAIQEAKACQAEVLVTRLQRPQPAAPADQQDEEHFGLGHDGLSSAEHRVAVLAALGYTNREIGRKLYITTSTVEQHLTRVYRKLKLNSRRDLPAGLFVARSARDQDDEARAALAHQSRPAVVDVD
jgi:DNA-binding NarL/FixJ family response regulator